MVSLLKTNVKYVLTKKKKRAGLLVVQSSLKQFNLLIGAQEAKVSAPLSPTLGQYGLSCQEFCQKFNDKTKFFETGIPLRVVFKLLPDKKFDFEISSISFKEAVFCCLLNPSSKTKRRITILEFYKLLLVQLRTYNRGEKDSLKMLFGTLRSLKVSRIII